MPARPHPIPDRSRGASARAFDWLRAQILAGRLRPGVPLSENEVAQRLGVSRTPIREAFIRLADEGLLTVTPQVGTRVTPISLDAVADSQFLREAIECRTVAAAAQRAGSADRAELRRLLAAQRACCRAHDAEGFFALDEAMHQYLLGMSGRSRLWRTLADAKFQLDRVRHLSLEDPRWLRKVFREHEEIVRSVVANDEARAVAAMQSHLRSVFDAVQSIAAQNREYFSSPSKEEA